MSATVMDTLPDNKGAGPKLKGKHILFILLGFFGIVFAVNGYFAYSALHTFPGELPAQPMRLDCVTTSHWPNSALRRAFSGRIRPNFCQTRLSL